LDLQSKLLRAIQEGEIERIGSHRPIKATFRLIAATNVDLEKAVKDGRFRDDLYYRINVIPIKLPPLRDRVEDLPELARFFLARYNTKFRKHVEGISDAALRMLTSYWWPGNIRELENLVERLVAITDKTWITEDDLPFEFRMAELDRDERKGESLFQEAMTAFERNLLIRALEKNGWNVTGTARYLGLPLSTLKFKLEKLDVREFAKRLRGN
jgi:transcriptional regulator with PAS, ATPase and Fis domain